MTKTQTEKHLNRLLLFSLSFLPTTFLSLSCLARSLHFARRVPPEYPDMCECVNVWWPPMYDSVRASRMFGSTFLGMWVWILLVYSPLCEAALGEPPRVSPTSSIYFPHAGAAFLSSRDWLLITTINLDPYDQLLYQMKAEIILRKQ